MYTGLASLLLHLASLPSRQDAARVLMFSYGSGLAATAYMLSIDTKVWTKRFMNRNG